MSVQINYKSNNIKKSASNLVLFVDEKFNISNLKKHILKSEHRFISDLMKIKSLDKKIAIFDISSKKKIILVSIKKNMTSSEIENLGAKFYDQFKELKNREFNVNSDTVPDKLIIGLPTEFPYSVQEPS